ncbi:hypothetical protein [Exiguobacterium sp. s26]|uniref:hypothetical protein n=1 Tax=Exiguobacterium sp. s26 TaxID=2751231 RepID=UPI001BE81E24|nr:hypothetical protein [Exiguobacterium sp. s26]
MTRKRHFRKIALMVPVLLMAGCSNDGDDQAFKTLETEHEALKEELGEAKKRLSDSETLLKNKDEEIDRLGKEIEKLETAGSTVTEIPEDAPIDSEIPLPGNPELPSPVAATHEPTAAQREQMSDLEPFDALITSDENLPVYDSFTDQDNSITELTPGYSVMVHATSDDGMWYYVTTTTYDGDPISGFVFAVFVRDLSSL